MQDLQMNFQTKNNMFLKQLHRGETIVAATWVAVTFSIFIFYFENYYFNMLEAKATITIIGGLLALASFLICFLLQFLNQPFLPKAKEFFKDFSLLDCGVMLFLLGAIFSVLASSYKDAALTGSYGWGVGALYWCLMTLLYFFLSRKLEWKEGFFWLLSASCFIQFLMVLGNAFYIDPLGFHEDLLEKDYIRYVGTIGNTNWYVGFVTLVLPFFLMGQINCFNREEASGKKTLLQKVFLPVVTTLGFLTLITCNCDGSFLGLAGIFVALFVYGTFHKNAMEVLCKNGIYMMVGAAILRVALENINSISLTGFGKNFLESYGFGYGFVIFLLLYVALKKMGEKPYELLAGYVRIVFLILVFAGGIFLIWYESQIFDETWGTNRGKTWEVALKSFAGMPFIQKIFGGGMNCFGYFYLEQTGSDWVRNAHNEYLEYLVTAGVFGFAAYLMIYVGMAATFLKMILWSPRMALKKKKEQFVELLDPKDSGVEALKAACVIAVAGYGVQALVNNPQALNGAIFITILAIYRRSQKYLLQ